MPRRPTPTRDTCTHVTIRCNNKDFLLNLSRNYDGIISWLASLPYYFNVRIHHFVIMSNHIHLLVTPQNDDFGVAMSYCLTNLAKFLNHKNKRINHVFGNRYCPSIITKESHLINVIRYIYQNPVRAGITSNYMKYRYSSLGFYLSLWNDGIPIYPDPITKNFFNQGIDGHEQWIQILQKSLVENDVAQVRNSLARYRFRFSIRQLKAMTDYETTLNV